MLMCFGCHNLIKFPIRNSKSLLYESNVAIHLFRIIQRLLQLLHRLFARDLPRNNHTRQVRSAFIDTELFWEPVTLNKRRKGVFSITKHTNLKSKTEVLNSATDKHWEHF